uniref:Mutant cadherin n=1 Tax=Heliothis virescens TaxID=7102 RepID=A0A2A4JLC1_HELVI
MSLNTVKCNSCNVVINELLAFLRSVLDIMDEESVHRLCTTSFTAEEIVKAKTLLFESIPSGKKMPVRRKDGKKKMSRDLDDMICLLKGTNPELFPIFVAKELHKLPPVSFDHVDVTRLLKDIIKLQHKVSVLEENTVTMEQFDIFKLEVENMKHSSSVDNCTIDMNVNKRRGACLQNSITLDSGPIGLQYVPIKYSQVTADSKLNGRLAKNVSSTADPNAHNCISVLREQNSATENNRHVQERESTVDVTSASEIECVMSNISTTSGKEPVLLSTGTMTSRSPTSRQCSTIVASNSQEPVFRCEAQASLGDDATIRCTGLSEVNVSSEQTVGSRDTMDSEWKLVKKKRSKQNRLDSRKGTAITAPDGRFRAADIKVPLLISNVSTEASEDDIIRYIKDKTSETVTLKKINMKSVRKYSAYKLYVSKHKADLFLNSEVWPDGIVFRRFVHFMYRTKPKESKVTVN